MRVVWLRGRCWWVAGWAGSARCPEPPSNGQDQMCGIEGHPPDQRVFGTPSGFNVPKRPSQTRVTVHDQVCESCCSSHTSAGGPERGVRPVARHGTRPLTVCLDVIAVQLHAVPRVRVAACLTLGGRSASDLSLDAASDEEDRVTCGVAPVGRPLGWWGGLDHGVEPEVVTAQSVDVGGQLSLIHISEPTRLGM